ncbi:spore germination protein KA [Clostridium algifaecis]|uniref:Spore germination protein KA n=1 Tax=Clostridium algifaecis TaxID=1472040 RepID=A0ABS4KR01_9CLOT|nr:spore germination protein [Clostridium algifaecis]MBP2031821.1 spore germination protein KA [Clostridium algifaecis]
MTFFNDSNFKEYYSESKLKKMKLYNSLDKNITLFKKIFGDNSDLVIRNFSLGRSDIISAAIFYFDNLTSADHIDSNILQPLLNDSYAAGLHTGYEVVKAIRLGNIITRAQIKLSQNVKELIDGLVSGGVLLFIDGLNEIYIITTKVSNYRPLSEAEVENVVRGPRDSFNEVLSINIGLIRKRIHNPNLIFQSTKVGKITKTAVCIGYIKGICSPKLIDKVRSRISKIDTDVVLSDSYIEEFINDKPFSIFPQMRNTERPDVAAAALLEGRVVIIVDNTPVVLIAPGEFCSLMQSAEDYYNRYVFSTLVRILRYFALIIALILPSLYIAIVNFHQELIPTKLLEGIIAARSGVPLPNFAEAFLMEITFEILREAGVRLPRPVGPAVSIVGALVIGQAAVQASIVSPLMVIIVALTGIATFSIPQYNISLPIRVLRFFLMILSSIIGICGLAIGLSFILIHMCSIRSFGTPYLTPLAPFKYNDLKDTIVRSPLNVFKKNNSKIIHNKKTM